MKLPKLKKLTVEDYRAIQKFINAANETYDGLRLECCMRLHGQSWSEEWKLRKEQAQ